MIIILRLEERILKYHLLSFELLIEAIYFLFYIAYFKIIHPIIDKIARIKIIFILSFLPCCKISSGRRAQKKKKKRKKKLSSIEFHVSRVSSGVGLTISRNKTRLSTLHCLAELTMPALVLTCSQIPRIKQHPSSRSPRLCCFTWNDIRIEMAKACFASRVLWATHNVRREAKFSSARGTTVDSKIEIPEE